MADASTPDGTSSAAADLSRTADKQDEFEQTSDFANYFCTYEYLYHQKQMLEDQRRMSAYHDAIMKNKHHFQGKVVLDVGAGSGILSIWAAKAGARKVYGVEATRVAENARRLVAANGLADKVEIICSKMEDIVLPEKVDVIISEWMGYLLLRESMLDSVLVARDKFLKPDGMLYPSRAEIFIAPVFNDIAYQKNAEYQEAMNGWVKFHKQTQAKYGVTMECLTPAFRNEQMDYYLQTSTWQDLGAQDMVGKAAKISEIDVSTITIEELKRVTSEFSCPLNLDTRISGFAGWFSVIFEGNKANPCNKPFVTLDTAPGTGYTHWGQQLFVIYPPINASRGDQFCGSIEITRRKENQRLLNVLMKYGIKSTRNGGKMVDPPVTAKFQVP